MRERVRGGEGGRGREGGREGTEGEGGREGAGGGREREGGRYGGREGESLGLDQQVAISDPVLMCVSVCLCVCVPVSVRVRDQAGTCLPCSGDCPAGLIMSQVRPHTLARTRRPDHVPGTAAHTRTHAPA